MSKLSEMIARLCPNGVEYKKLGEIGEFYSGLSGKAKDDFKDGNAKFITYMNVYSNPALKIDVADRVKIGKGEKQNLVKYGDVLFTGSSETPDECGMTAVLTQQTNEALYLNSFCFGYRLYDKAQFLPDFLKHLFRSSELRAQIKRTASGVTRFNVSKTKMAKVSIPLPPLPVQREIVQILDNFANLTAELTAELAKRKKQYEHYRRELFTGSVGKKYLLENLCSVITDGSHFSPKSSEEGYDMPSVKDMTANGFDYSECKKISRSDYELLVRNGCQPQVGDVLIAKDGALMLKHAFPFDGQREIVLLSSIALLRPRQEIILPKFLAYYFRRNEFKEEVIRKFSTKGGVPRIILKNFKKVELLVPPLAEQERIVAILDRFDSLCNSLTEGLPAEIALRKKQYEYYRDKLLSFKEAS